MEQLRSVLIIQTAFIGDVVLATAIVEALHQRFPETTIDFVVRNGNEELLVDHPLIRNLFVLDKRHKYKSLFSLVKIFRKNHYDYVINVQRFATTGLMTILAGSRNTIGFDKNPLSMFFSKRVPHVIGELHEVDRNLSLLRVFNISSQSKPRLYPSKKQFEKVQEFKGTEAEVFHADSPAYYLPEKKDVYTKMEALIYHFKIVMGEIEIPVGELYSAVEGGNGELGFYLISDGGRTPYRLHFRRPCFIYYQAYPELVKNGLLSDAVITMSSLNLIAGELDA